MAFSSGTWVEAGKFGQGWRQGIEEPIYFTESP
jgi:hypothetical protein